MKDYYFILGIARNADHHEIKEAFRKLSLKYHPDRTVPTSYNHERYMEICEAYRVLSNKEKRMRYDGATSSNEASGIIPEIQTSYKGHYPWFALFAVVIVAAICILFISEQNDNRETSNVTPVKKTTLPQPTPKREPKSIVIIDSTTDSTVTAEAIAINKDTVVVKQATVLPPTDTLTKTQAFIASALDKHTVEPNKKKHPTSERNFKYSFRGEKLFVTYEHPDERGKVTRKQVAIPIKKIESVYVYAGQLWITSPQKAIQVMNLKNGQQEKTDFFSVRFNTANTPGVEEEIAQAFASLKADH